MKRNIVFKTAVFVMVCAVLVLGCAAKAGKVSFEEMKNLLKEHALVVAYHDGTVKIYDDNGIKPLFKHLETGNFKGAYVFDKVTGKASSLILAYGGAENLYTGVLSKEAIPVLERHNIEYSADIIVDFIENRDKTDKCPMEKTVAGIDDPQEAYAVLKEKFAN